MMFGSLLDKATGWLDPRLFQTIMLPALAFWAGVVTLLAAAQGWNRTNQWWNDLGGARQLVLGVGAFGALLLFSLLLQVFLPTLIRGYEGYWFGDGPFARGGRWLQRRRLERLGDSDADDVRRYRQFPPSAEDVMPTRLGNVLASAEFYARDDNRYGARQYGTDARHIDALRHARTGRPRHRIDVGASTSRLAASSGGKRRPVPAGVPGRSRSRRQLQ